MDSLTQKAGQLPRTTQILIVVIGFAAAVAGLVALYSIGVIEVGYDWRTTFYPAAHNVFLGKSPYEVNGFVNVPWTVLVLLPFAVLPLPISGALFCVISIIIYCVVAFRLGADLPWLAIFLISPFVLGNLYFGNLDCLALVGLILPPPIGIFFVLIKPQIGIGIAAFWLVEAWRKGRLLEVLRVFAPVGAAILISIALFGNWTSSQINVVNASWNTSWWPWSLPVGLVLLVRAVIYRKKNEAIAASPFLSPYVAYPSWVGVLLALIPRKLELIVAVAGMYLTGIIGLLILALK
jgi:hypothetical protein